MNNSYQWRFFEKYTFDVYRFTEQELLTLQGLFASADIQTYIQLARTSIVNQCNYALNSYSNSYLALPTKVKIPKNPLLHNPILDEYNYMSNDENWVNDNAGNSLRKTNVINSIRNDITSFLMKELPKLTIYAFRISPEDLKEYSDRTETFKENFRDRDVDLTFDDIRNFDYPQEKGNVTSDLDLTTAVFDTNEGQTGLTQTGVMQDQSVDGITVRTTEKNNSTSSNERDTLHDYEWTDENTDKVRKTGEMLNNNIKTIINWPRLTEMLAHNFMLIGTGYGYD